MCWVVVVSLAWFMGGWNILDIVVQNVYTGFPSYGQKTWKHQFRKGEQIPCFALDTFASVTAIQKTLNKKMTFKMYNITATTK